MTLYRGATKFNFVFFCSLASTVYIYTHPKEQCGSNYFSLTFIFKLFTLMYTSAQAYLLVSLEWILYNVNVALHNIYLGWWDIENWKIYENKSTKHTQANNIWIYERTFSNRFVLMDSWWIFYVKTIFIIIVLFWCWGYRYFCSQFCFYFFFLY